MSSEAKDFLTLFGERLRLARKQKGKTQLEVASHLGIGKNAISRYERGEVEPGAIALSMIACYLDVTVDSLLHGDNYQSLIATGSGSESRVYETAEESLPVILNAQEELELSLTAAQITAALEFAFSVQANKSMVLSFLSCAEKFAQRERSK